MTNRMDTNPQRVPDRRHALITHFNDLKMPGLRLCVCVGGVGGGCSREWVLQMMTCLYLQQF